MGQAGATAAPAHPERGLGRRQRSGPRKGKPRDLLVADAPVCELSVADRADRDAAVPADDRRCRRSQADVGTPDLLRAGPGRRPPADAAGKDDRRGALRPVRRFDPDDAAAAVAAAACRSACGAAGPARELQLQGRADRRRRAGGRDRRPRRARTGPVPVSAVRSGRQRQAHVHSAVGIHEFRDRAEDRPGAGRGPPRVAARDRGSGRPAGQDAPPQARRDAGDPAHRHRRTAARSDRPPAQDAAGAHRRGADVARHGRQGPAREGAGPAEARPQHPARRGAGADGRRLARRPAAGAGPQDGLSAGRPRDLPGRGGGPEPAELCGRVAPARDAAAAARRPSGRWSRPSRRAAPRVEFSAAMGCCRCWRAASFETRCAAYEKVGSALRHHTATASSEHPLWAADRDIDRPAGETLEKEGKRAADDERPISSPTTRWCACSTT